MEKEENLYELIRLIQRNQKNKIGKDKLIILLEKFRPLILKYKHLLRYEDAEYDLVVSFIEIIESINLEGFKQYNTDYRLLSYISIAMKNKYIYLSKLQNKRIMTLQLEEWYYQEPSYTQEQNIEIIELLNNLRIREQQILIMKYWYGYSDIEVGKKLNISRQTVNRLVKVSLKKLRELI